MLGILRIAYKLLVNDKGKFIALLMGLTFSVFLMIQMTSMFAGMMKKASATVTNTGAKPVFHGGALYYQRKAAVDARDAAAAEYRQTVLGAFEQVADVLRGLRHDADAVAAQSEAVETAEKAMHLIQANYVAGIATYLQVLIVDQQYLQAKIAHVQAVGQRLQDTVALYVALGGGWWNVPALAKNNAR